MTGGAVPEFKEEGVAAMGEAWLDLLLRALAVVHYKFLWKIKNFMWLMLNNNILTNDKLIRRGWTRNEQCNLCSENETVDHILFRCSLARFILQEVYAALNIQRCPVGTEDPFREWIMSSPAKQHKLILCGSALLLCYGRFGRLTILHAFVSCSVVSLRGLFLPQHLVNSAEGLRAIKT